MTVEEPMESPLELLPLCELSDDDFGSVATHAMIVIGMASGYRCATRPWQELFALAIVVANRMEIDLADHWDATAARIASRLEQRAHGTEAA